MFFSGGLPNLVNLPSSEEKKLSFHTIGGACPAALGFFEWTGNDSQGRLNEVDILPSK